MRTWSALQTFRRLVAASYGISKTGVRLPSSTSPTQVQTVGEDAYFIALSDTTGSGFDICGVADGVGGWHEVNINPARFSRSLMDECLRLAKVEKVSRPSELIKAAYEKIISPALKCYGGSTVSLLSMDRATGTLHTANLGDSGFMVVRKGQVLTKSPELQHYFNCPYQLTNPPPNMSRAGLILDSPSSAALTSLEVLDGDIIVLATDGFFDNIPEEEVVELLSGVKDHTEPSLVNACIEMVSTAHTHSNDPDYQSPFARKLGSSVLGGKPDDITVVMAAICGV